MPSAVDSDTTVYLITGTNRGLGLGTVQLLASRPNTLIYAAAREPSKADKLKQLAQKHDNIRLVQLSVDSDSDHAALAKQVSSEAGRVDVVLANAGYNSEACHRPIKDAPLDEFRQCLEVNAVGVLRIYQHFLPLLQQSKQRKFIVTSSVAGSIASQWGVQIPIAIYCASKAATNMLVQRIHIEQPDITAVALHPGWVSTDMGNTSARAAGLAGGEAPVALEDSCKGIVRVLDEADRSKHGGKLWDAVNWEVISW